MGFFVVTAVINTILKLFRGLGNESVVDPKKDGVVEAKGSGALFRAALPTANVPTKRRPPVVFGSNFSAIYRNSKGHVI